MKYWTRETEEQLLNYLSALTQAEKENIYMEHLHQPLTKLVECICNTYKCELVFQSIGIETAKKECLGHLVKSLDKFNFKRGKAFGYFGTAAKNYFACLNINLGKHYTKTVSMQSHLDEFDEIYNQSSSCESKFLPRELWYQDYQDFNIKEFMLFLSDYLEQNRKEIIGQFKFSGSKKKVYLTNNLILDTVINELKNTTVDFTNLSRIMYGHNMVVTHMKKLTGKTPFQLCRMYDRMKPFYHKALRDYLNHGMIIPEQQSTASMVSKFTTTTTND